MCKQFLVVLLCLALTSCAAIEQNPRAAKGTGYGALGGAAAGAAIGAIVGGGKGAGTGAAIGAVVGAVGGGLIGSYMDSQAKEMQGVLGEQDRLRVEQEKMSILLSSDVLFDTGKASLYPGSSDKLRKVAQVLNRYPRTYINVVGHTDSRGSEDSNLGLSRRRAQAVADALIADGVAAARVSIRGEGELRPVATNETPEGRAQNRRVEIDVQPDEGLRAEQQQQQGEPR